MEYLLSNIKFGTNQAFKNIFFKGDFTIQDDILSILEHQFVFDKEKYASQKKFIGSYNKIEYCYKNNTISIKNDEFGMLSLFYAVQNSRVYVSNNIWLILESLSENDQIHLDKANIAAFLQYSRIPSEENTFFKNIYEVPAASEIEINLDNFTISKRKYWHIEHNTHQILSVEEATHLLHQDLSSFFKFIKEKNPNTEIGFGNSGGLDSRLIPYFTNLYNLKTKGFITGNRNPRFFSKSTSHESAHKISNLFNFEHQDISYKQNNYSRQLKLDIKNNLFSGCQIFKNPIDSIPNFDLLLCGGDGFIVSNDNNKWSEFISIESEYDKINFLKNYISKSRFRQFSEKITNKIGYKSKTDNLYLPLFEKYDNHINAMFEAFISQHRDMDNLSLIRSFHQLIYNKNSPSGGFESLNRTKDFAYIYYPFVLKNTLKWPLDYFLNRKILCNLVEKYIPKALDIPDQTGKKIKNNNKFSFKKYSQLLKGNGLDYRSWYNNDNSLHNLYKTIINRNNPMFEELIDSNTAKKLHALHPNISLDVLKVKKTLDIIYFNEFDDLKQSDFEIINEIE